MKSSMFLLFCASVLFQVAQSIVTGGSSSLQPPPSGSLNVEVKYPYSGNLLLLTYGERCFEYALERIFLGTASCPSAAARFVIDSNGSLKAEMTLYPLMVVENGTHHLIQVDETGKSSDRFEIKNDTLFLKPKNSDESPRCLGVEGNDLAVVECSKSSINVKVEEGDGFLGAILQPLITGSQKVAEYALRHFRLRKDGMCVQPFLNDLIFPVSSTTNCDADQAVIELRKDGRLISLTEKKSFTVAKTNGTSYLKLSNSESSLLKFKIQDEILRMQPHKEGEDEKCVDADEKNLVLIDCSKIKKNSVEMVKMDFRILASFDGAFVVSSKP